MSNKEIQTILSKKGLRLMGGEVIHPTRQIDGKPELLDLEHTIVKSIRERSAGGTKLNQLGIELVLGLGIGSICVVKDPKNYLAFGVVHPGSNYKEGKLVIAQIGKHANGVFWTPDHLNPAKPDKLNLAELVNTCSAISQLATVGDHSSAGFAGIADPRHLSSVMSTVITGSRASNLIGSGGIDRQVHIADDWEKDRSMASIITKNSVDDLALIPIPITVRKPILEASRQPDLAIVFPRYLVDQDELDKRSILAPLSATQAGALELLQAMAYHQVVKYQAGDGFSRVVDSHR
jgi:hypothetical protein